MNKKSFTANRTNTRSLSHTLLTKVARMNKEELFEHFSSSENGLPNDENFIEKQRDTYGDNKFDGAKPKPAILKFIGSFLNPFTGILFGIAIVTFLTDVIFSDISDRNYVTFSIVLALILFSGILHFVQERKSSKAMESLASFIETTTAVIRDGTLREIPIDEVVVGDLIHLAAGDVLPCDGRIVEAKDLFVTQAALTGESEVIEKHVKVRGRLSNTITDIPNLVFMGTTVVSGSARMLAVQVGHKTLLGETAKKLTVKAPLTNFEKGIKRVSLLLIYFMLAMVPVVFLINGFTKRDWTSAFLFAVSIAVGLTPEMLPMIVTTCLAKGASMMAKKKVIIKKLSAIQNFGAMDILCTDKTGTLTQDKVILEQHLDVHGDENIRVLRHAFLNSYFQTGLKNILDLSIINKTNELATNYPELSNLNTEFQKIDEVPFDFNRKCMSVVVKDHNDKVQMITKGAVEEILDVCAFAEYRGEVLPLDQALRTEILANVHRLNLEGMRVIALAQKSNPSPVGAFSTNDECDMVLMGYLTFLDPPKPSAKGAIKDLEHYGVTIKILTGDNEIVTQRISQDVGLNPQSMMLGSEVENLNDDELKAKVDDVVIFAKLLPHQKARIVRLLKEKGHVVGYLGDGINDASAMREADIGISVDTAVDIAKESADVVLLEKNLSVLKDGLVEGRKVYNNLMKYIKITASSNFGNILAVIVASFLLPFLPMLPVQLILLNMIYDISCTSLPWDRVDEEYLLKPRKWEVGDITRFIFFFGPLSTLFDVITYLVLYLFFLPMMFGGAYGTLTPDQQLIFAMAFQTGWFIESMWSQSVVIHVLRSKHVPLIGSKAAPVTYLFTGLAILIASVIGYIPYLNQSLKFYPISPMFFIFVIAVMIAYILLASLIKKQYIKRNPSFL